MILVLVQARARHCALETCGVKKMQAPLLGLAKSIYYYSKEKFCLGYSWGLKGETDLSNHICFLKLTAIYL